MTTTMYRTETMEELDGSRITYEYVEPEEETLRAFFQELFEQHWARIVFGPCVPGSVFEVRLQAAPTAVRYRDGYLTVDLGYWHFHLCLGLHKGPSANPTPPAVAQQRRAAKAAFFHVKPGQGGHGFGSWGFRMWNGNDEQMLTVFFPNPSVSDEFKVQKPDWSRLELWNAMRVQYLPGAAPWAPDHTNRQDAPVAVEHGNLGNAAPGGVR